MAESILADELGKLLLKTLVLDKLAEGSELTEEDIAELDKRIKRGLRLRIEAKSGPSAVNIQIGGYRGLAP